MAVIGERCHYIEYGWGTVQVRLLLGGESRRPMTTVIMMTRGARNHAVFTEGSDTIPCQLAQDTSQVGCAQIDIDMAVG